MWCQFSHTQPECECATVEGQSSREQCLAKRKLESRLFHAMIWSLGFQVGQCLSLPLF